MNWMLDAIIATIWGGFFLLTGVGMVFHLFRPQTSKPVIEVEQSL